MYSSDILEYNCILFQRTIVVNIIYLELLKIMNKLRFEIKVKLF